MGDAAFAEAVSRLGSCSIQDGREDHISESVVADTLPMDLWSIIISRNGRTVDLMAAASVCRYWRWVGSKVLRWPFLIIFDILNSQIHGISALLQLPFILAKTIEETNSNIQKGNVQAAFPENACLEWISLFSYRARSKEESTSNRRLARMSPLTQKLADRLWLFF